MTLEVYKKAMACVPEGAMPEFLFNNVHRFDPSNDGTFVFFDEATEMFTTIRPNKLNQQNNQENPWQVRFTSLELLEHMNFALKTAEVVDMLDDVPGVLFGGMSLQEAKKAIRSHRINKSRSPQPTVKNGTEKKVTQISAESHTEVPKDPYKNIQNGTYHPPVIFN